MRVKKTDPQISKLLVQTFCYLDLKYTFELFMHGGVLLPSIKTAIFHILLVALLRYKNSDFTNPVCRPTSMV